MIQWQQVWEKITSPVATIESKYEQERIALYSALLFILTCLFIVIAIILIIIPMHALIFKASFSIVAVCYGLLYILSRTAHYRWSARIWVWLTVITIVYSFLYLASPNSRYVLNFINIPIMIAGFLLSRRETIVIILSVVLGVILIEVLHPQYDLILSGVPLLIAVVGSLTLAVTAITERYYHQSVDNEARYRNLMQANFEAIIVIDKDDARILDANPAMETILGYSRAEVLNCIPMDYVYPEDKAKVQSVWDNNTQEAVQEIRLIHKQGYTVYTEATMRPYTFLNEPAFVLTLLDISDRKQVETLMIESEKRFRAIFNESSTYFSILDTSGRVLEFNQSVYDKFGLNSSDSLGRYIWEFEYWAYTDSLKTRTKELIQEVVSGREIRREIIATDKDGNTTFIDLSMKAVINAENIPQMVIVEGHDTTAYNVADAKRTELEQRYQAIFEHTTDAVFIIDMNGKFISINKRAEDMLLISSDNLADYEMLDFIAPEEREQSNATVEYLVGGGTVSHVPERKMQRSNGEMFYGETVGMIVKGTHDNSRYIQSMVRDITERKRQEKVRFDSALQHERTQLLTHFIENASHYFRTPITNMKTRLYLLPRVADKPEKRDEQVEVLNIELERLQNLLDDLLTVLRLQKDDTEYSLTKVPVSQLLIEVQQSFAGRSAYENFHWTWQSDDIEAIVIGDKGRLGDAIFNLVENAMAYTPIGESIVVHSFVQQDYVAIDVINSGEGIKEDDLPYIFDDFYRGQDAMAQDSASTGLGLTITKMIVERHQGRISVMTPEAGGAHFQILLPLHTEWHQTASKLPDGFLFPQIVSE